MLKSIILGTLLTLSSVTAWGLNFSKFSLENGMDVYVIPDHRSPVVVNFVWYNAGAGDEETGQTGIAHMLEHLMFKGTKNIPPQEFSKIVARHGGQDNAFTSYDYTAYFQKIGKDNLPKMMEIEADRMRGLTFTDKEFLPERDVVMEERRWRVDSKPEALFFEEFSNVHFPHYPYGRPVIGWKEDIQNYTSAIAHNWYNKWYQPANATLILVGDITLEKAQELVAKTYATLPSTPKELHQPWPVEPLWENAKTLKKVDPEVKQPLWVRSYRVPSRFAGIAGQNVGTEDALALSLLAQILGGGNSSILYESLVKEGKQAVDVSVDYSAVARGESSLDVVVYPNTEVKLVNVEKAFEQTLQQFLEQNIKEDNLQRAKTKLISMNVYDRDDPFVTAYRLGRWLTAGGTAENFDTWLTDIKNITVEDIHHVAQKYLVTPHYTTGYLVGKEEQFE